MFKRFLSSFRWLIAFELVIVVVISALGPRTVLNFEENVRVRGPEFSYLVGSGAVADIIFDATGRIPLWNSWMGRGEPLLENSFSYVNNPFMFLPVLAWGMFDGPKIAIVIHAVIAGVGGWLLAYVAGLKTGGRLLSAALFAGSGGMVGAIGMGFYQMSLSQAYVPWIYAGTIGILRRRDRWPIGVLVLGTSLLLFSGTFWYVLPTAFGVALLILFGLLKRNDAGRWHIDTAAIGRIAIATVLIVIVSATRLIPQAVNHAYVDHVEEFFPNPPRDFFWTANLYFSPTTPPGYQISALFYFYALAPVFLVFVIVGRMLIVPVGGKTPGTWRILIPAAIAWFVFTTWAQEGGEVWVWLYQTISLLREWRFVTRMLAAGIPFLILIVVICFDDLVNAALRWMRTSQPGTIGQVGGVVTAGLLLIAGAVAGLDAMYNWQRESGVEPVIRDRTAYFQFLRQTRPDDFISVQEWDFFGYWDHYEMLIRTNFGNPDYRAGFVEPTLATPDMMRWHAPEALEYHGAQAQWLADWGYIPMPAPNDHFRGTLWVNPAIPPYAFVGPVELFDFNRLDVLRAEEVTPVDYHYMKDAISITLADPQRDQVVVVTEVAYPGWIVLVNDRQAPLESVGGLIGVRVTDAMLTGGTDALTITFTYRPLIFYVSTWISLIGAFVYAGYLLRVDRLVQQQWHKKRPARPTAPVPVPLVG